MPNNFSSGWFLWILWSLELVSKVFHDFSLVCNFGEKNPDLAKKNSRPHISWLGVRTFSMVALTSSTQWILSLPIVPWWFRWPALRASWPGVCALCRPAFYYTRKNASPHLRPLLSLGKVLTYLPHIPQLICFPQLPLISLSISTFPHICLIIFAAPPSNSHRIISYYLCFFYLLIVGLIFRDSSKTHILLLFVLYLVMT